MITPEIFSAQTAIRLYREESDDLALVHPNLIKAASRILAEDGDHERAEDILITFDKRVEDLNCLIEQAKAEFGI